MKEPVIDYFKQPKPPEITAYSYMRGEPIEAMTFSLIYGLRPEVYRQKKNQNSFCSNKKLAYHSHKPDRVSLGKGFLQNNAASMAEFGSFGNVIYLLDSAIENAKTFRANSEHLNNGEFLIKGISPNLISALVVHDSDLLAVKQKIKEAQDLILKGKFILEKDQQLEVEKIKRFEFLQRLPIISFEEEIINERKLKKAMA